MLSEPLVKLNSVYVKVQEALLHLRGDLLVGDTGVVGKAVGGTARIFDAQAFYAQQARQILRKFGADAHMFVPGVGYMNGFQAGNYLESTGQTNAAVDGAVGLVLDAAGSVGPELAAQQAPDISTSAWQKNTATVTGQQQVNLPTAGTSEVYETAHGVQTANKTFKVTLTATGSGTVSFGITNAIDQAVRTQVTLPGTFTFYAKMNGTSSQNGAFSIQRAAGDTATSVTVSAYSYKEVTGTHATQATTANKPILRRGIVNLLTYSNDFSNAVWGKNASPTLTYSYGTGPYGPSTRLQGTGFSSGVAGFPNIASGTTLTAAFVVRNISGSGVFRFGCDSNPANGVADFTPSTGAMVNGGGVSQSSKYDLGGGWWLVACTYTTTAATNSMVAFQGNATALDVEFQTAGLFQGTLTAAQIIAAGGIPLTTTAPASSSAGAYAWQFDGSNDALALPGPLFQMADDHCVVAAAKVDSGSITATVFSESSTAANGPVIAIDFTSGAPRCWWRDDAQANFIQATDFLPRVGQSLVVSLRKTGNAKIGRCNGVQMAATDTAVMGATTINTSNVGALVRTTSSGFMQGNTYAVIIIKGTVSDADLRTLEKWLGSIAGVAVA